MGLLPKTVWRVAVSPLSFSFLPGNTGRRVPAPLEGGDDACEVSSSAPGAETPSKHQLPARLPNKESREVPEEGLLPKAQNALIFQALERQEGFWAKGGFQ